MAIWAGRQKRDEPGFAVARKHDEAARCCQGIVDAGDPDVGAGARFFQLVTIGEGGVDLREPSDAALT